MNKQHISYRMLQAGLSIVELMVATAIGMLLIVVVMQVFSVFESRRRTTIASADALAESSIAAFTIEHDVQMAGYGLQSRRTADGTAISPSDCDLKPAVDDDDDPTTPDVFIDLTPVYISDGGSLPGASDAITIGFAHTSLGGLPQVISAIPMHKTVTVPNTLGCQDGDIALILNPAGSICNRATKVDYVISTTDIKLKDDQGVGPGLALACLGSWIRKTYSVIDGTLHLNGQPHVPNVVALRAWYGVALSANSSTVSSWVSAKEEPWQYPSASDRKRIKAIRLAVASRSGHWEKEALAVSKEICEPGNGVAAWQAPEGTSAPKIDLSNIRDCDHYRYRVFDTIIPLRNAIWSKA